MLFGFTQYRDLPEWVPIDWSPAILMTGGPYAVSRHPMYVGELALWLGWVILYGSVPVLIGFAALGAVVARLAPREERALEAKFGDAYRRYKARVPRWVGLPRRERAEAEGAAPNGGPATRSDNLAPKGGPPSVS
jgi:protein-S-isoprenylcysteine O-methyltransferase Ste14